MKLSNVKQLLLDIASDIDYLVSRGYRSPGIGISVSDLRNIDNQKKRKSQYQVINRLKKRKLLEEVKKGDDILYKLTDEGFAAATKVKILTCKKELESFEVCLVVFDVPESMKEVRNHIRKLLKDAGFYMVQRSVWESTLDVINELEELISVLKADEYILVYRALRKLH